MLVEFKVRTAEKTDFVDITSKVEKIVKEQKVKNGYIIIFIAHTTAAVTINESADPDVCRDMKYKLDDLIAWHDNYRHAEGNSAAHIKSSLIGSSEKIIIDKGNLVLGTWQGIFLTEFDGPRLRKIKIKIVKD